jgi:hypothetical protein
LTVTWTVVEWLRFPEEPVSVRVYVAAGVPAGVTVRVAVLTTPASVAVMVTGVDALTALVLTVNVALAAPAGTLTLAGTIAADMLLVR